MARSCAARGRKSRGCDAEVVVGGRAHDVVVVDDDLEPLLGEAFEELGGGSRKGVGQVVVLVEDLMGDGVVDD
jgi:hypothetical protein